MMPPPRSASGSNKKRRGAGGEALGDTTGDDDADASSSASASASSSSSLSRRQRGRMTRRGLGEMREALDMIPAEEKKALTEALERAPELVRLESSYERCVDRSLFLLLLPPLLAFRACSARLPSCLPA
jgi:hypothetical protein